MKHLFFLILSFFVLSPNLLKADEYTELPLLKQGRWRVVIEPKGVPNGLIGKTEVFFCTDEKSQPRLIKSALNKAECTDLKVMGGDNKYRAQATCPFIGQPSVVTVSLDFISERQVRGGSNLQAKSLKMNALHEAKYLGMCEAGEKPGSYKIVEQEPAFNLPQLSDLQQLGQYFQQ